MSKETFRSGVLGSFDGLVSVLGIILAAALAGVPSHLLLLTALGGAVAATVSMAGGEFLADPDTEIKHKVRDGLVMGLATFIGSFLPVLPYLVLGSTSALITSLCLSLALAACIAEARASSVPGGRKQAYRETLTLLIGASALAMFVTRLFGAII